jgi:chemotaxis protein histidine kinase CheA
MVSELLRECRGHLSVSTKPGSYTRFFMRLPKQPVDQIRPSLH